VGVPTGQVYSWGTGSALGHGAPDELDGPNPPRLIEALAHAKVAQVACGPLHSLVLTEDNVLYSFGYSQVPPLSIRKALPLNLTHARTHARTPPHARTHARTHAHHGRLGRNTGTLRKTR
jgi:alpha-tubulin suppressor-like RCC1 family protein